MSELVQYLGQWVGGRVGADYRALGSTLAGCIPDGAFVRRVGPHLVELSLVGGTLGGSVIFASSSGEDEFLFGAFLGPAELLVADGQVERVRSPIQNYGVLVFLFEEVDGSCAMLYQHDNHAPIQVVPAVLGPMVIMTMEAHGQIANLQVDSTSRVTTIVETFSTPKSDTVRFTFDPATKQVEVAQSRSSLVDPQMCPESAALAGLLPPP
ncbi:MAG: hypothetical protein M3256_13955 [Actinomycetota bacterium]|nr:hypothetical protein [Actinomycetota bacterium]